MRECRARRSKPRVESTEPTKGTHTCSPKLLVSLISLGLYVARENEIGEPEGGALVEAYERAVFCVHGQGKMGSGDEVIHDLRNEP